MDKLYFEVTCNGCNLVYEQRSHDAPECCGVCGESEKIKVIQIPDPDEKKE